MLTLSSLSINFGGLQVLQDVNLTIPEGGVFGLIGPNGAGKTTVFNLVTGLLAPSAGKIEFSGRPIGGLPPHRVTRRGIARTFQNIRIFKDMSLLENVLVALAGRPSYGVASVLLPGGNYRAAEARDRDVARGLLAKVGLVDKPERRAGMLSYGEQRRLEIARALATRPKLLLLDEPAAGMNAVEKQQLIEEIIKLNVAGLTILIIEHDMSVIMGLCHSITVLNFGRIIASGTPDEIRANPEVIEAYLGRDDNPLQAKGVER
ncbi:MAG TPA: ABC transporter ATP-binding protein [Candidatus Binatia bacterium]|nr:ABC transporter ATP-binding protein [Candidatus Binatia bacterium]